MDIFVCIINCFVVVFKKIISYWWKSRYIPFTIHNSISNDISYKTTIYLVWNDVSFDIELWIVNDIYIPSSKNGGQKKYLKISIKINLGIAW